MIDMTPYSCMTREELEREYGSVLASYEACKAQLSLIHISEPTRPY